MCEAKRQKHLTHKFSISVSGSACSNGLNTLRFVGSDAVYFSFQNGRLMSDDSCTLFPPLLLQYHEIKYKCYLCFHGNQLLKFRGTSLMIQILLFQKRAL